MEKFYSDKNSFKVPENYFEELQQQILYKAKLQKRENFEVPENYFDKLHNRLQNIPEVHSPKTISFIPKRYLISGLAASIIVIFGLIFFYNNHQDKMQTTSAVAHQTLYNVYLEEPKYEEEMPKDVIQEYYELAQNIDNQNDKIVEPNNNNAIQSSSSKNAEAVLYELYLDENQHTEESKEEVLF